MGRGEWAGGSGQGGVGRGEWAGGSGDRELVSSFHSLIQVLTFGGKLMAIHFREATFHLVEFGGTIYSEEDISTFCLL